MVEMLALQMIHRNPSHGADNARTGESKNPNNEGGVQYWMYTWVAT